MSLGAANLLVTCLSIYAVLGVLFATCFVVLGLGRIDPAAKAMSIRVRLLIFPGCAILWPLMLFKCFTQTRPPLT